MSSEEALEIVEQILPPGTLTPIKRLVFQQSWNGKGYTEIARELGYDNSYIRDIGSQLWRALSEVLKEPINKKNFRALLQQRFLQGFPQDNQSIPPVRSRFPEEPEYPGRAVPLHSKFYISHPHLEQTAYAEISKPICLFQIKAPPKMGKSSFLIRVMNYAVSLGYHAVILNFKQIETQFFSSLDQFLRWFCTSVSYQLELEPRLERYWNQDISYTERCALYFTRYLLPQINRPLVLAFNNFDEVFNYPQLAQDFLFMIQAWHEEATQRVALQKIRLILVYSGDIDHSDLPKQFDLSDMGRSIRLPSFNEAQVQVLAQRYEFQRIPLPKIHALTELTGGHPYLVQLALYSLWMQEITLDQVLHPNSIPEIYQDHLQSLLSNLQSQPELTATLKQILENNNAERLDLKAIRKLQTLGLIKRSNGKARLSCQLYQTFFRQIL
ncbi:AAA-like domain-containing protein [Egbenema bharatensis]|uniref:AAA-like domain-containing protein n=1 Tax=Egbenema bharatensis TaxID=3463334 RepID=UPI003A85C0FE